jgi:hypothetical protein
MRNGLIYGVVIIACFGLTVATLDFLFPLKTKRVNGKGFSVVIDPQHWTIVDGSTLRLNGVPEIQVQITPASSMSQLEFNRRYPIGPEWIKAFNQKDRVFRVKGSTNAFEFASWEKGLFIGLNATGKGYHWNIRTERNEQVTQTLGSVRPL